MKSLCLMASGSVLVRYSAVNLEYGGYLILVCGARLQKSRKKRRKTRLGAKFDAYGEM